MTMNPTLGCPMHASNGWNVPDFLRIAVYQLVAPYLAHTSDRSWQAPMRAYRARNAAALDNLDDLDLSEGDREVLRAIVRRNLAFMDACLQKGCFAYHELEAFAREC